MNSEYAKVILDSVAPHGKRITTLEVKYWRAIHSEVMTHRVFSRNAASSRAIPFLKVNPLVKNEGNTVAWIDRTGTWVKPIEKCTYSMIHDKPFIPEYIGAEQKGMQSGDELCGEERAAVLRSIDRMRQFCLEECKIMAGNNAHKSIINRYLEPWSYITVVITSTEWENFLTLRTHGAAEKHLQKIAKLMRVALDSSKPTPLQMGDWHLPYIVPGEDVDDILLSENPGIQPAEVTLKMIQISTARCARVSYLNQDGQRDIQDDLKLYSRLRNPGDGVIHASPFEHAATPTPERGMRSGNFVGWQQHRKAIPGESGER